MDREPRQIAERALKQVEDPALAKLTTRPKLEKVLAEAARSGKVDVHELGRTTRDFGREAVAVQAFSSSDEETGQTSWAVLILLLLLMLLLAALIEEGRDATAELRETIQDLIDELLGRGRGGEGDGGSDGDGDGDGDGTENDGREDEEGR